MQYCRSEFFFYEIGHWEGANEGKDWVQSITLLEEIDNFAQDPEGTTRFRDQGGTSMYELYFLIQTK